MKKYKVSIKSSSSYLPPKVVTNFDIAEKIDTSDEWIYNKLGINRNGFAYVGQGLVGRKYSDINI